MRATERTRRVGERERRSTVKRDITVRYCALLHSTVSLEDFTIVLLRSGADPGCYVSFPHATLVPFLHFICFLVVLIPVHSSPNNKLRLPPRVPSSVPSPVSLLVNSSAPRSASRLALGRRAHRRCVARRAPLVSVSLSLAPLDLSSALVVATRFASVAAPTLSRFGRDRFAPSHPTERRARRYSAFPHTLLYCRA